MYVYACEAIHRIGMEVEHGQIFRKIPRRLSFEIVSDSTQVRAFSLLEGRASCDINTDLLLFIGSKITLFSYVWR